MRKLWTGLGLGAMLAALAVTATPASAEFFGCNDNGKVVSSYIGTPADYGRRHPVRARYTHEFAAQSARPRITIQPRATTHPGPNSKRYCRSWLAKEFRVSGTVIVPRMQCWWQ